LRVPPRGRRRPVANEVAAGAELADRLGLGLQSRLLWWGETVAGRFVRVHNRTLYRQGRPKNPNKNRTKRPGPRGFFQAAKPCRGRAENIGRSAGRCDVEAGARPAVVRSAVVDH